MSFLRGSTPTTTDASAGSSAGAGPELFLRFSSSVQGRPRAIGWGRCRVAVNCIWYAGFRSVAVVSSADSGAAQQSSGKGGFLAPSAPTPSQSAPTTTTTYKYFVDVVFSICEGPVAAVGTIWRDKYIGPAKHLGLVGGDYGQTVHGFLAGAYPDQALAYRGDAYLIAAGYPLGTNSSLPNLSVEVVFAVNGGGYDANPADVVFDFLTNPYYGIGFDAALLGDFSAYRAYCGACGLNLSGVLTEQTAGNAFLQDLAVATNMEFRWSAGQLTPVPYADADETGNGYAFDATSTPIYDLTIDDFMPNQGSLGSASNDTSIAIQRMPRADMVNRVRLEYFDRGQQYNPAVVEASDEAAIVAYGNRPSDLKQAHLFAGAAAASRSASLQLHRAQIGTRYQFTLDASFILLDPMDVVTLTEPALGLDRQPVRIVEIQENDDSSLTFTCDEYHGTITAPLYERQACVGTQTDFNADPGPVAPPLIFEPPYLLAGELAVWCAICGQVPADWGGCNVWVSTDDATYTIAGTSLGGARMGTTTADLPQIPYASRTTTTTSDAANTLSVDLSQSNGALISVDQSDMLAGNTAMLVGDEVLAYQNATLTAKNRYDLKPLQRGLYDTDITAHPAGTRVARLDAGIFKLPYTPDRIGETIFVKFQSFNLYGGGEQDLSEVGSITYKITGAPLAANLEAPQNVRTVFVAGFEDLAWDEVEDFRPNIRYRVYRGDSFITAQQLGDVAHPPFRLTGTGTYWVTAYCQPIPGLTVTSDPSSPVPIVGNMLVVNPLKVTDQAAPDANGQVWAGAKQNLVLQGAAPSQFLALAPGAASGTYRIPSADIVDLGYAGVLAINVSFKAVGVPVGQNILATTDILASADILSAASSQFIDAFVEIRIGADTAPNDMFATPDVFDAPDVFTPVTWGPWQKYMPGNYPGRYADFRITLSTSEADVTAYLLALSTQVAVDTRVDHYQNLTVPVLGLKIVFKPDGAAAPAPFNGGPNGAALPYVNIAASNAQAGDVVQYSSLTPSSVKISISNGGSNVSRTGVNVDVQGY